MFLWRRAQLRSFHHTDAHILLLVWSTAESDWTPGVTLLEDERAMDALGEARAGQTQCWTTAALSSVRRTTPPKMGAQSSPTGRQRPHIVTRATWLGRVWQAW